MKNFCSKLAAFASLLLLIWILYYHFWGRHLYLVTAYCNCPICVNVPEYHDGQFASGKKIYWGGIAADRKIPFGAQVELVPVWPSDFKKIHRILRNRKRFRVEDRGGKIRGKHIDLFIPKFLGGHKAALRWGRQKVRIRINGKLAE
ncbi:MAG: 3D domain-containing protein [Candidatus Omnitrophica bacterium]|nr:3D domain-containing protein [Candidatus Omnitrophota bacterium]